ncbi:hypothetical protein, partial [Enterococcus faecium]|uniref:hypothetical protein n=1 Tax=Enterococcus faecium TaxID=1352 RepID=UPI002DB93C94
PRSKIFYERGFIWCALILSLSFMSYFSYTFYLTNRRKEVVTEVVSFKKFRLILEEGTSGPSFTQKRL